MTAHTTTYEDGCGCANCAAQEAKEWHRTAPPSDSRNAPASKTWYVTHRTTRDDIVARLAADQPYSFKVGDPAEARQLGESLIREAEVLENARRRRQLTAALAWAADYVNALPKTVCEPLISTYVDTAQKHVLRVALCFCCEETAAEYLGPAPVPAGVLVSRPSEAPF
jgi:hypothetical protein